MRRAKSAAPAAQVNPAARTELDRKSFRIASVQIRRLKLFGLIHVEWLSAH